MDVSCCIQERQKGVLHAGEEGTLRKKSPLVDVYRRGGPRAFIFGYSGGVMGMEGGKGGLFA